MEKHMVGHVQAPLKRIHIELTNRCDFSCVFCPKALMTRKYGNMDTGLAKTLISDIKRLGLAEKITLHVMGEPTFHPDFYELLDYAAELGQPVGLTTNGGGLSGKHGKLLLDHELYQLDVSLQTPDEASFGLRKAGKLPFQQYLDGIIEFFCEYRKRWPDTIFKFRFLNTTFPPKTLEKQTGPIRVISSSAELRETFAFWAGRIYDLMGTDQKLQSQVKGKIAKLKAWQWNVLEVLPNTFFETYILSDWGHAFGKDKVRDAWAGYCFGMRDHFAILYNGDVTLCCIDFDGKTVVGNVTENSLEEVLSTDELGRIIHGFKRFKVVHPYCKFCLGSKGLFSWLTKPILGVGALKLLKPYFYKQIPLKKDDRTG